jgi:uncharacterized protein (TIGR02118 family)
VAADDGDARAAAALVGRAVIKVLAPAQRHPTNRSLEGFHRYWAESHGPLFANTRSLRRYVQHLTLPEAYGVDPAPTFDGVSMFWFEAAESRRVVTDDPELLALLAGSRGARPEAASGRPPSPSEPRDVALLRAVLRDDAQLFDRSTGWPQHLRAGAVMAQEHVVVDGAPSADAVKLLVVAGRKPGLTLAQFFEHWRAHYGRLTSALPGLRRYVQNHALPEAYSDRGQSHDGWEELWFDDLRALHRATRTREWQAVRADAANLFADPLGIGVARERVQKDEWWSYDDWGVGRMSEDQIRERLAEQGYRALASDPAGPAKLRTAAAREALAVWTDEHLVTIDESALDVRPE